MYIWDLCYSGVIFFFFFFAVRADDFEEISRMYFCSIAFLLFDVIFTWWIRKLVLLLVDWNLSSLCYLHSTQQVLYHPCSYHKHFESLNHHSVITSQVPVWCRVDNFSESGYNLTVFRFSKINVLFAISSLQRLLWSGFTVCCITVCPVSSSC